MLNDNYEQPSSPFHQGEKIVQVRVKVPGRETLGRKNIRDHMTDQHRRFFEQQSLIFLAAQDRQQRPWASLIVGRPGFINTPSENEMRISGWPLAGEGILDGLTDSAAVGLLGLDFSNRRRNRMNGRISKLQRDGNSQQLTEMTIAVDQAFGNCPKYIQTRQLLSPPTPKNSVRPTFRSQHFSDRQQQLITQADSFFIASQYQPDQAEKQHGVDMSHRGGKAGFIRFIDDRTIEWPDFTGNFYFNTLGNLEVDPRAGLLFLDFKTGDMLSVTGRAKVIWDGPDVENFQGAERLVRFELDEALYIPSAYPLASRIEERSPFLDTTDTWLALQQRAAAREQENWYQSYRIVKIVDEAKDIRSFYLAPAALTSTTRDQKPLATFTPGQSLPIRITDKQGNTHFRSYSLSASPNPEYYRITVKRLEGEGPGLVSNHLHRLQPGAEIEAMSPHGEFTLSDNQRPVVLLSAGVGITPMASMLQSIVEANTNTGAQRHVYFIHGTQNREQHAFRAWVDGLVAKTPWIKAAYCYSQPPGESDTLDAAHYRGRINKAILQQTLPVDDYEFYLCGPDGFMQATYQLLRKLNVAGERIHYEFFGPSTLTVETDTDARPPETQMSESPVKVRFAKSKREAIWTPASGSLLELAEAQGIAPDYGCRIGQCNTCVTAIEAGRVHQASGVGTSAEGSVDRQSTLICCATPSSAYDDELEDQVLVLAL